MQKTLNISCSGGGGHHAAMEALIQTQQNVIFYAPRAYTNYPNKQINLVMQVSNKKIIGKVVNTLSHKMGYPCLPDKNKLDQEITILKNKNSNIRPYIDILLDIYPEGYESAALWNLAQKEENTKELTKLVYLHKKSDKQNYKKIYNYFYNLLFDAYQQGKPYTAINSTQVMGIPALCDAVYTYNKKQNNNLKINQYMTDLPTTGAVHFGQVFARMNSQQAKQINIFAVGTSHNLELFKQHFFPKTNFNINPIDPTNNPMVRLGFKKSKITQESPQNIATIMLGSQGGIAALDYVRPLLDNNIDHVFILGGFNSQTLQLAINNYLTPEQKNNVTILPNQTDQELHNQIVRSKILICRGGGLTSMELMSINYSKQQKIFFHHHEINHQLTTGIPWEDANINYCIEHFRKNNITAHKISVNTIKNFLK